MGLLYFILLLAVLLLPSTNLQWFDGLPAGTLQEYMAFLLAGAFLLFPDLRHTRLPFGLSDRIPAAVFWAILGGALALKAVLFTFPVYAGYSACYSSPADPVAHNRTVFPDLKCERSYENPFGRFPGTRMETTIHYSADASSPIFLNSQRYDYYDWESGSMFRNRIPVQAVWRAELALDAPLPAEFTYVGSGSVRWQNAETRLPESYAEKRTEIVDLGAGTGVLEIRYLFNDGARSGISLELGPKAYFTAGIPPVFAVPPAGRIAAVIADGLLILLLAVLAGQFLVAIRPDAWAIVAAAIWVAVCYRLPAAPLVKEAELLLGLFLAVVWTFFRRPFRKETWYLLVAAAGLMLVRVWYGSWYLTVLRSAGNDPLGFESQAYAMLATGTLEGGESIFYAQPFYRYVKFLEHFLFGDGDVLYAGAQTAVFLGGWIALFREGTVRGLAGWRRWVWLAFSGATLLFSGYYVSEFIRTGLPEYATWILALWAAPVLMLGNGRAGFVAAAAALALAFITRTNQLPGSLFLLAAASVRFWKRDRWTVVIGWGLAILIGLLPLAHNLYFGGKWIWLTSSSSLSSNLPLPPAEWVAFFRGDAAAGAAVREQLAYLFLAASQPRSLWPTLICLAAFALFWLGTVWQSARARRWMDLVWLLAPAAYLAPHLFFVVQTYYPRHIAIGYLSMAVVSAAVWILRARESSEKIHNTA